MSSDPIKYDTRYAVVDSFKIDQEGHGILTMHFGVNYDEGTYQGVGGYALDGVEKKDGEFVRRYHDTPQFMAFLMWVYEEFECDDYADLQKDVVGKPCIVYFKRGEGENHSSIPIGIKPFKGRNPMIFPEFLGQYVKDED